MIRRADQLAPSLDREITVTGRLVALLPMPFGAGVRVWIELPPDREVEVITKP